MKLSFTLTMAIVAFVGASIALAYENVLQNSEMGADNFSAVGNGIGIFPAPIGVNFTATALEMQLTNRDNVGIDWAIQLHNTSTYLDCHTDFNTNTGFGITNSTSTPIVFALQGDECDFLDTDGITLYFVESLGVPSVNAVNETNKWGDGDIYTVIYSGGVPEPIPTIPTFSDSQNTHFISVDITGTSTVTIDTEYFIDENELDLTKSTQSPTYVRFWYGTSTTFSRENVPISTVAGTSTASVDLESLADGDYNLIVGFTNFGCISGLSACPFPDVYAYTSFQITGGVLSATGTIEFYDNRPKIVEGGIPWVACSITQIGGCLQNAMLVLFYPSPTLLNNFANTWQDIQYKKPFGYVTVTIQSLQDLDTTTATTSFSFGALPLQNEVITPFRNALAGILWGIFAIYFYHRLKRLDI